MGERERRNRIVCIFLFRISPHPQGNVLAICGDDDRRGQVQLKPQQAKIQHSNSINNVKTTPVTTSPSSSATGGDDDGATPIGLASQFDF